MQSNKNDLKQIKSHFHWKYNIFNQNTHSICFMSVVEFGVYL